MSKDRERLTTLLDHWANPLAWSLPQDVYRMLQGLRKQAHEVAILCASTKRHGLAGNPRLDKQEAEMLRDEIALRERELDQCGSSRIELEELLRQESPALASEIPILVLGPSEERKRSDVESAERVRKVRGSLLEKWKTDELRVDEPEAAQDFSSVTWRDVRYDFSAPSHRAIVKALWDAWKKGAPTIREDRLKAIACSNADDFSMAKTFRKKVDGKNVPHPAWGTLIIPTGPATYALAFAVH
jgi:hypothetical protein